MARTRSSNTSRCSRSTTTRSGAALSWGGCRRFKGSEMISKTHVLNPRLTHELITSLRGLYFCVPQSIAWWRPGSLSLRARSVNGPGHAQARADGGGGVVVHAAATASPADVPLRRDPRPAPAQRPQVRRRIGYDDAAGRGRCPLRGRAREDPSGKAGLAHLVEHLMFEQRPDRGRDKDDVQDFEPSEAQRALEVPAAPTALAGRGPVRARQRHACRSPAGRRDAAGGGRPDVRRRPCLGAPRAWRSQGRRPS